MAEPHAFPRRILLAALAAMAIWGSFTAVAAGALQQGAHPLFFGLLTQLGIAGCIAGIILTRVRRYRRFFRETKRYYIQYFIGSLCFPLRDILFLIALANAPKLTVSAIDALWPIFLVLLSNIFVGFDPKDFRPKKLFLLLSAFGGAGLLVYEDVGSIRNVFSYLQTEDLIFYVSALGGAIMAAGENISLRIIRDRAGVQRSVETTIFLSGTARIPFFFYAPAVFWFLDTPLILPVGALVNLGVIIFGWTVASILFTYAVLKTERSSAMPSENVSLANIGSIAYLSPVSNAILLSIFFPEEQLAGLAIVGISLVVLSNMLINADMRYIGALSGTMVVTIWICVITSVTEIPANIRSDNQVYLFSLAEISGAIFAILASFTLWRLSDSGKTLQKYLWQIGEAMQDVVGAYRAETGMASQRLLYLADVLLRLIVRDALLAGVPFSSPSVSNGSRGVAENLHDVLLRLRQQIEVDLNSSLHKTEIYSSFRRLDSLIDSWITERRSKLTIGEMFIMFVLGGVTVSAVLINQSSDLLSQLFSICFASGVVFLLLIIRDLNRNRWNFTRDALASIERLFESVGCRPYLPRDVLDTGELEGPSEAKLYRTESIDGSITQREFGPTPYWMNAMVYVLLIFGLISGFTLVIIHA